MGHAADTAQPWIQTAKHVPCLLQSGDSIIVDVSGDGNVVVLNGDKEVSAKIDAIPAGIS